MSQALLRVLAVDDELPQLEDVARILRASPHVGDVETASSAREAITNANSGPYDAIFLDVRMPDLGGLEVARVLKAFARPPAVVFVSAFDISAGTAFGLRAIDYILKPVAPPRVDDALRRVLAANAAAASDVTVAPAGTADPVVGELEHDVIVVHHGRGTRLLPRSSILYVKAYGDYLRVFADSGRYLVRGRLTAAEARLRPHGFLRVHRQYLANLRRTTEVRAFLNGTAQLRLDNGSDVPVARRHVPELRRWLRSEPTRLLGAPYAPERAC